MSVSFLMIIILIPFFLLILENIKKMNTKGTINLFLNEFGKYVFKLVMNTLLLLSFLSFMILIFTFAIKPLEFIPFVSNYYIELIVVSWTLSFFYNDIKEQDKIRKNIK